MSRDFAAELHRAHAYIWRWRALLQHVWPTPPGDDALRFAACEAAEALDAWLRLQRNYARNNAKELSITDELFDTLLMLLTALGPQPLTDIKIPPFVPRVATLEEILERAVNCLRWWPHDWARTLILLAAAFIMQYPDLPPLQVGLESRLLRIARKVLPPAEFAELTPPAW